MKSIFLSYRFTGESAEELKEGPERIADSLKEDGRDVFFSLWYSGYFEAKGWDAEQMYSYCLNRQEQYDICLLFVKSDDLSKGMDKEVEKAQSINQRIILAIKKGLDFKKYWDVADMIVTYTTFDELCEILPKRLKAFDEVKN